MSEMNAGKKKKKMHKKQINKKGKKKKFKHRKRNSCQKDRTDEWMDRCKHK